MRRRKDYVGSNSDPRRGRRFGVALAALVAVAVGTVPAGAVSDDGAIATTAISVPKGEGSILGMGESFSAGSSTGIFSQRIPLTVPAGRGGMQPSLALTYSSGAGAGLAGVGWDLPLPSISRQTDRGIPRYVDSFDGQWTPDQDRFVFGSDELVPLGTIHNGRCTSAPDETFPSWAEGWQYFRARIEGEFRRFFWSADHLTWRVQAKSGATIEFGVPLDGSGDRGALEADPAAPARVYRWLVVREYDNQGPSAPASEPAPKPPNVVAFRYESQDGTAYITDIYDTPPATSWASAPFDAYAHHVRFAYESRTDPLVSFRRGYRSVLGRRLVRVDVTSKTNDAAAARELVRRYHLEYVTGRYTSLLAKVQLEGRCGAPVAEGANGLLPTTNCGRLPPMSFTYTVPAGTATSNVPSWGLFNTEVKPLAGAPSKSLANADLGFLDVDGDGLDDLLRTSPAQGTPEHAVFFNGGSNTPAVLGAATPIGPEAGSVSSTTLSLATQNVVALDADSDGVVDLLHMPVGPTSRIFGAQLTSSGWKWTSRPMTTPTSSGSYLDVTGKRANLRVMDVNDDGLVDIVVTESSRIRTYFNLGRYPNGDGKFGSGTWSSPTTATLQTTPIDACTPGDSQAVRFEQDDITTGDLNGDGITDIARLRSGNVIYWPGRGDGTWGVVPPPGCGPRPVGSSGHVTMANAPAVVASSTDFVQLADMNGDGLADVVHVRGSDIAVFLNQGGVAFAPVAVRARSALLAGVRPNEIRLVDVDGNGVPDVVTGTEYQYTYFDILGRARTNLLTRVTNGLGASTDITYEPSTTRMLDAATRGDAWTSVMPIITQVVRSVTVSNNLPVAARPASSYTTTYDYRDPVYDGVQREFRGFRGVFARTSGNAESPPSTTHTVFLPGECVDETADAIDDCGPAGRSRDNAREALKGLPVLVETYDDNSVYLDTKHTQFTLRHLLTGLDGRRVRHAFGSTTDSWAYDTSPFVPASQPLDVPDVVLDGASGAVPVSHVTLRSSSGRAHLVTSRTVDRVGNTTAASNAGCVDGCPEIDEVITARTDYGSVPGDGSGWLFQPTRSWVEGASSGRRKEELFELDDRGRVRVLRAVLAGSLPLTRHHEAESAGGGSEGTLTAPTPQSAATDGTLVLAARDYDIFGNVVFDRAPNNRCRKMEMDAAFASLAVGESVYVGALGPDRGPTGSRASAAFAATRAGSACGAVALTATATYDRGLGLPTIVFGLHGEKTIAQYDGLGRTSALFRPDPILLGVTEAAPSESVAYDVDETGARPYMLFQTTSRAGASNVDGAGAVTTAVGTREAWAYVDGFGRAVLTLEQSDPTPESPGAWIVSGLTEFDAKGKPRRVFEPWSTDTSPTAYALSVAPTTPATLHEYDAFGREFRTTDTAGQVSSELRFHALATDIWDGADLRSSEHFGTYTTERRNGHGRTVSVLQRQKVGGAPIAAETRTQYLPTGEPERITRSAPGAADIVRWMAYDTLGRMVENVDPHTTKGFSSTAVGASAEVRALRYVYGEAGELVGTSDARGCGVNYFYDAGGRRIAEDYSPCLRAQAPYTAPDLATGDGTEVFNRFDEPEPEASPDCPQAPELLVGRISATSDRGGRIVTAYDARGRAVCASRQISKPGAPAARLDERYASGWFSQSVSFDDADRPIRQSTGATAAELLGPDGTSDIVTTYSARGLVKVAGSSYGPLVREVARDPSDKVRRIVYGDVASTTTLLTYDAARRLETVRTERGAPALWSQTTPTYTPASPTSTLQTVLDDVVFAYDDVGNPRTITDARDPSAWPAGAKPVSRAMQYDDLYRVVGVTYQYAGTAQPSDAWVSPFDAEDRGVHPDPRRAKPAPRVGFAERVTGQTFAYDAFGNTTGSDDDTHAFYDRSLGVITNDAAHGRPYQLASARIDGSGAHTGHLDATYDDAGYMKGLSVVRSGPCLPSGATCSQRFAYDWDEVGNLVRARRWDLADPGASGAVPPSGTPDADLEFAYDGTQQRVRKTSADASGVDRHTLYPTATLELRRATFDGSSYERTAATEVPYLFAHGVRLARVAMQIEDVPSVTSGRQHVLLQLPDYLGSTSTVIDKDTSELVERVSYLPFGQTESDYRPERWASFREDSRFTGKEEDIEVGLTYFGKRFLQANLGRWASADPLAIHAPGKADLNVYAYVSGQYFTAVDPVGLEPYKLSGGGATVSDQADGAYVQVTAPNGERAIKFGFSDAIARPDSAATRGAPIPYASTQEQFDAAVAGMKRNLLDTAGSLLMPIPAPLKLTMPSLRDPLARIGPQDPAANPMNLRQYQLHENFVGGQIFSVAVQTGLSLGGEGIVSSGRLALTKLPALDGIGAMGGGRLIGFSEQWASEKIGEGAWRLAGANKAVIDPRKLTEYALNPLHPVGKHKARVFESALGYNQSNYEGLLGQIRSGVMTNQAIPGEVNAFGARFTVDIPVTGPGGSAVVRTGWIYTGDATVPSLATLFVH